MFAKRQLLVVRRRTKRGRRRRGARAQVHENFRCEKCQNRIRCCTFVQYANSEYVFFNVCFVCIFNDARIADCRLLSHTTTLMCIRIEYDLRITKNYMLQTANDTLTDSKNSKRGTTMTLPDQPNPRHYCSHC